jgi:predicted transcriptional regulator
MSSRILEQPHREQYEIIQQLLQTARSKVNGCKQFELACESQLNWPRFEYYRDVLLSNKLLVFFREIERYGDKQNILLCS